MKQVTQQLFHSFLTFDLPKVESFVPENLDHIGKNLLYILHASHLIQLKSPPSAQQIKQHLDQYFYVQMKVGSWQKDEDFIILLLLLLLGKREWHTQTHFHLAKLTQYVSTHFMETYFNQPNLKKHLGKLSDLKSSLSFISILKGIYYTLLGDDVLAMKYLHDHDAVHRGIAHYYLLRIALKQKQIEQMKKSYDLLSKEPLYQPFLRPIAADITKMINTYERPDFLKEMAVLNHPADIDKYIVNAFSKRIYDMMHDDTRKMIHSGFYITARMTKLFLDGKIDDYSTFALPFVKAFELECYRLFKRDYLQYLTKENIPPFQAIPAFKKHDDIDGLVHKRGNHYHYDEEGLSRFSIGQISFIVGIPSHFLDPQNPEREKLESVSIHATFKHYWQKRMKKRPEFLPDAVIKEIAKDTFTIKAIRNQIAHAEIITWAQLDHIVRLIFESGQIRRLVEMNGQ